MELKVDHCDFAMVKPRLSPSVIVIIITITIAVFHTNGYSAQSGRTAPLRDAAVSLKDTAIIGHMAPDTDAVCSAIAAAHLWGGTAVIAETPNRETMWVLQRFGVPVPPLARELSTPPDKWALVDHASESQLPKEVDKSRITMVVDHHKVSEDQVATQAPIHVDTRPWGCTCTILTYRYSQLGVTPPPAVAGLMLSAIVSDTLNARGPTTTEHDKAAMKYLAGIAGVTDVNALAKGMFLAKSELSHLTPKQIVLQDFKTFAVGGSKFGWGAVETVEPKKMIAMEPRLRDAISEVKLAKGLRYCFLSVTDISPDAEPHSFLVGLAAEDRDLASRAFPQATSYASGSALDIGRLTSRKKQFVPAVTAALRQGSA